jgi:hypothetical protein
MIYFFTVASPARSGTKWFSSVFTTRNSFCYHELTTHLLPYPANIAMDEWLVEQVKDYEFELAQRRWILQCYPEYFARLWERNIYGQYIVGNSDHFSLRFLPGLWLLWPTMKFIFSVRNGINVVQSTFLHEKHTPLSIIAGWKKRWGTEDFFTICCYEWVSEVFEWRKAKDWLGERAQCIETKLELITKNLDELHRLWDWVGFGEWEQYEERNRNLMATPINARVNQKKNMGPDEIWSQWNGTQREVFLRVCGETMKLIGYTLPEAG